MMVSFQETIVILKVLLLLMSSSLRINWILQEYLIKNKYE
jgi:hypothetical protein